MKSSSTQRLRLLVLSHVLPFPGSAGQQRRVYYKLKALKDKFHITFLTVASRDREKEVTEKLSRLCDDAIVLPSRYAGTRWRRGYYRGIGWVYALGSGLKFSNYLIDRLEMPPRRVQQAVRGRHFDVVLFEYWHATGCTALFRKQRIPTVLDMHNILWQSYQRQLAAKRWLPSIWRRWAVRRYRQQEERAWNMFDALIAINKAEEDYVRQRLQGKKVFYAPMGTDLQAWPYTWQPVSPPRLAYYGGLGSPHNQRSAWFCYQEIMPHVWKEVPSAELWIVGSNPPAELQALSQQDPRVIVTGFVPRVQDVLKTMSVVFCPWWGTYGFRSRIVEVMALGVPVVATPQAVYGMEMVDGEGIFLREEPQHMAGAALALLRDLGFARQQSRRARHQVEKKYSYESTYQKLTEELVDWLMHEVRRS